MKYCTYCGKQLNDDERCTCPGALEEQKAKQSFLSKLPKDKLKKLAIPAAILLVVIIAIICLVSFKKTEIDLAEYIEIEGVTGLNGMGVIDYHLIEGTLMDALLEDGTEEEITDENAEAVLAENWAKWEEIDKALSCISVSADKESGLSNGDVVTITATFKNEDNYKFPYHFKDASVQYTASGLQDGIELDAFAEGIFSLTFTGFTGTGEADLEILAEDDVYNYLHYELSDRYDLSNGDPITVSVTFDPALLEEMGYFPPKEIEKTYIVTDLNEYLTDPSLVSNNFWEQTSQELLRDCQGYVAREMNEYNIVTLEPELVGYYFATTGDPSVICSNYWYGLDMQNALIVLVHYTMENTGFFGFVSDHWRARIFPNCYLNEAGNLLYDDDVEDIIFNLDSPEEFAEEFQDDFHEMVLSPVSR